ncbi:hypothetical protein PTKIN_Ptkin08bG0023800 [Pterospermum kingtungense]
MAEALVSAVTEQLLNVITNNAKQEWRLVTGVDKQIQNLQGNLQAIRCVIEDAEEKQIVDKGVKHWLARLKEVAYYMEDVVDEWKIAILKLEIDGAESVYVKKRYELARREIKKPRRLESTSFVDVSTIHGRDKVKNKIVSTLLGGNDIQTISTVGMGGFGKTAFAHFIFHDDKVRTHFQNVIWVCVSDFFDQNKIALAILGGLDQNAVINLQNPISLQNILTKISEKIKSAKFLLVLDDVWTDRNEDWVPLKATFQTGMPGSKILMTTRKKSVARVIESSDFDLEQLSGDVCWLIVKQLAFKGKNDALCRNLEDVGREIAKKCNGLPLAAKAQGSFLWEKKTENEWRNTLNSKMWRLNVAKEYIFTPLLLSYYDLPSEIRPCLLYCAIFPKDFVFRPAKLINHWMAHGYLSYNKDLGIEEEMYLTNEEIVEVEINSGEDVALNLSSKKAHHLRVTMAGSGQFSMSINGIEKLRSLLIMGMGKYGITLRAWQAFFQRAKCLRVLEFKLNYHHEFFNYFLVPEIIAKEIEKLIHLRCLDLSWCEELRILPEEMCKLYNLQYLNLSHCGELVKLPEGIGKLINLRSLDTSGCDSLMYNPKGIGKLISLRKLTRVIARADGNYTEKFSVGDLENLDLLHGYVDVELRQPVINVTNMEELKRAKLHNKIHLQLINFGIPWFEVHCSVITRALNPPLFPN